MSISTHVLDTSAGRPADGLTVYLESLTDAENWRVVETVVAQLLAVKSEIGEPP